MRIIIFNITQKDIIKINININININNKCFLLAFFMEALKKN